MDGWCGSFLLGIVNSVILLLDILYCSTFSLLFSRVYINRNNHNDFSNEKRGVIGCILL